MWAGVVPRRLLQGCLGRPSRIFVVALLFWSVRLPFRSVLLLFLIRQWLGPCGQANFLNGILRLGSVSSVGRLLLRLGGLLFPALVFPLSVPLFFLPPVTSAAWVPRLSGGSMVAVVATGARRF